MTFPGAFSEIHCVLTQGASWSFSSLCWWTEVLACADTPVLWSVCCLIIHDHLFGDLLYLGACSYLTGKMGVADLRCCDHEQHVMPWNLPGYCVFPGLTLGLLSRNFSDFFCHFDHGWCGCYSYNLPTLDSSLWLGSLSSFHCTRSLFGLCLWMALVRLRHNRCNWGKSMLSKWEILREVLVLELPQGTRAG